MIRSMTGPGQRRLADDLRGIGGAVEGIELGDSSAIISEDDRNRRGMSPLILFEIPSTMVCVPVCGSYCLSQLYCTRMQAPGSQN
jgi:hypothetical protein